jgi:hypothetical protein
MDKSKIYKLYSGIWICHVGFVSYNGNKQIKRFRKNILNLLIIFVEFDNGILYAVHTVNSKIKESIFFMYIRDIKKCAIKLHIWK